MNATGMTTAIAVVAPVLRPPELLDATVPPLAMAVAADEDEAAAPVAVPPFASVRVVIRTVPSRVVVLMTVVSPRPVVPAPPPFVFPPSVFAG